MVIGEIYQKRLFKIVHILVELLSFSSGQRLLSTSSLIILVFFVRANMYFFFLSLNTKTSIVVFRSFAAKPSTIRDMQIDCKLGLSFFLIAQVQFYYYSLLIAQNFQLKQLLTLCRMIRGLSWALYLSDIMEDEYSSDILV